MKKHRIIILLSLLFSSGANALDIQQNFSDPPINLYIRLCVHTHSLEHPVNTAIDQFLAVRHPQFTPEQKQTAKQRFKKIWKDEPGLLVWANILPPEEGEKYRIIEEGKDYLFYYDLATMPEEKKKQFGNLSDPAICEKLGFVPRGDVDHIPRMRYGDPKSGFISTQHWIPSADTAAPHMYYALFDALTLLDLPE